MNGTMESGDKISQIERLRQEELDKKELGIAGPSRAVSADSLINWDNSPVGLLASIKAIVCGLLFGNL